MKTFKFLTILLALLFSRLLVQAGSFNAKNTTSTQDSLVAVKHPHLSDYRIMESGAIIIYERQHPGDKLNLFKPVITHYFSVKGSDKVYLLSLENLKKIYRDGQFFTALDTYFSTDGDLLSYDRIHHEFKINYYLSKTDRA